MKSGVILVNKPSGYTSFDIIAILRGVLRERRLGHAGTLDPMAAGVLPVLAGTATRAMDLIPDSDKEYIADFKLGASYDTLDTTGRIAESGGKELSESDIRAVLPEFTGEISQLPPMYSAVSVNGVRLYEYARRGEAVKRQERQIRVSRLELTFFDEASQSGRLEIKCSKGTYIRSLIDDIARRAGSLGAMSSLLRTVSHGFRLSECLELEKIRELGSSAWDSLISTDRLFECYPTVSLGKAQARMYKNGVRLDSGRVSGAVPGILRVYSSEDGFLGLCRVENGELTVYRNFWTR